MKASLYPVLECECGHAMYSERGATADYSVKKYVTCSNPKCSFYGEKFFQPEFELKQFV